MIPVPMKQVTFLTDERVFAIFTRRLDLSNSFFKKSRAALSHELMKIKYEILSKDGSILFSIALLRAERKSENFATPEEVAKHKMQGLHHFHITFRKGVTVNFVISCMKKEGSQYVKEIMELLSETPLAFDVNLNGYEADLEKDLKTFLENTFKENSY